MKWKSHSLQNKVDPVKWCFIYYEVYINVFTHSSVTAPPMDPDEDQL